MTRVLVAAASPVVRQGLEAIVTTSPLLTVVGTSGVATLAAEVEALQPDVVILEWELQDEGLPIFLLAQHALAPAIVVLANDPRSAWVAEALRASSVRAILPHEATASQIVAAVEAVADGLVVMHLDVFEPLLLGLPSLPRSPDGALQALSPREIEVLGMIAEGLGNKTIARRLGISEHTVKFHISSIFTKLNASSRTEAVIIGARQGLIML